MYMHKSKCIKKAFCAYMAKLSIEEYIFYFPISRYTVSPFNNILGSLTAVICLTTVDLRFFSLYICPIFDYCDVAWCGLSTTISDKLEVCQRKLLKMLFCLPRDYSSAQLYVLARVCPLSIRRSLHSNMLIQKIKLEKVPRHLFPYDWFVRSRSTRAQVSLPVARTVQFTKSPLFHSYSDWLKLSSLAHHCHSMFQFRQVVCTELRFSAAACLAKQCNFRLSHLIGRALFSPLFLPFHCFLVFVCTFTMAGYRPHL